MKRTLIGIACCLSLLFVGCKATLKPGPYGGGVTNAIVINADMGLYAADSAFVASVTTLDLAFRFEKDNRDTLWKISPSIKHGLDKVRPVAEQLVQAYKSARVSYIKNPTPAGLDLLNTLVPKIQQSAVSATAAINTK